MKTFYRNLSSFSDASGLVEVTEFFERYPGLQMSTGSYFTHLSSETSDNFGATFRLKFASLDSLTFEYRFSYNLLNDTGYLIKFENATFTLYRSEAGVYGEPLAQKALPAPVWLRKSATVFDEFRVMRGGGIFKIEYMGSVVDLQYDDLLPSDGDSFKFSVISSSSSAVISDYTFYEKQTLFGLLMVNGATVSSDGVVQIMNQVSKTKFRTVRTSEGGRYITLLDVDPGMFMKFMMYGYSKNRAELQPRGVCNITVQS